MCYAGEPKLPQTVSDQRSWIGAGQESTFHACFPKEGMRELERNIMLMLNQLDHLVMLGRSAPQIEPLTLALGFT